MTNEEQSIDSFSCEYAFLSNFYPSPLTYEGISYPTVEHAFQAQKTFDETERKKIAQCKKPGRAKGLGRKVKLRQDWESVKVGIMTEIIRIKFESDEELKTLLLETGTAKLIEGNTWNDRFWGVCGGKGKNWLGRILMQIREEFQSAETETA